MEPALYQSIYRLQKSHWWHLSRQRFLDVLLRDTPNRGLVLDAGCGPGSMLSYFGNYGLVVGVDGYRPALDMARSDFSGPLVQGDCCILPFQDGRFSLVAACEVLYHRKIVDVRAAVQELVRVVEPGGALLVVDSAFAACYSAHDLAAHGARRFTRRELTDIFMDEGLEVVHATYAYAVLLPVVWIVRRWKALFSTAGKTEVELKETWGPLNKLLIRWFTLEARVAGRWGLPWGLSVQILGRKPEKPGSTG